MPLKKKANQKTRKEINSLTVRLQKFLNLQIAKEGKIEKYQCCKKR